MVQDLDARTLTKYIAHLSPHLHKFDVTRNPLRRLAIVTDLFRNRYALTFRWNLGRTDSDYAIVIFASK
jgi:hypothetical protein